MAKQFTLGREERLKSRKQIELLFSKGLRFNVPPFRIFYTLTNEQEGQTARSFCFGVGVGTRFFKKAVDRNRIKRLIKEACRLQKNELSKKLQEQNRQLNVFFIYTGKELPDHKEVTGKINKALYQLLEKLN